MDKQSLVRSLENRCGAFVNVTELSEYLKVDRGTARRYLYGLPFLKNGTEKKYFAGDVAQMLMERTQV